MKKLLLALALLCAPTSVWAQCTGIFPANTFCGNSTASAAPPVSTAVSPLVLGQIAAGTLIGNPSAALASAIAFTIQGQVNLATPNTTQDFLPIWDHLTGTIKNVTPSALTGGIGNTPHTQDFIAGTNFTAGSTTTLTISSTPAVTDNVTVYFDGVAQSGPSGTAATWSISGAIITFNAAIPTNTQVVEVKWSTSITLAGVATVNGQSGTISLLPGATTAVTTVGNNITFGNNISTVSIMDTAYAAKCNAIIISTGTVSIASGAATLTATAATFTSADVGKSIWVPGAGAAGAGLSTTITAFTNATHVTLNNNASTTLTTAALSQASNITYGTDDTTAINAAIAATPTFGTLVINPITSSFPVIGCLIKQSGSTGRALLVDHPINITGGGNLSALVTDPSMGTTVIGIYAPVSGLNWNGVTWQGFTLGTNLNFVPFTRYGGLGIYFDATSGGASGFLGVTVQNLRLGESGNNFSLLMDGVGTQGNRFDNNTIWGGLELSNVIDSNIVSRNRFQGASIFGVNIIMTGGNFQFTGNSTTAAGGLCIAAGAAGALSPVIQNNYFEENALTPPNYQHNAFVDIGCGSANAIVGAVIENNIIANIIGTATLSILTTAGSSSTTILKNFIANNNARTAITNNGTSTNCGPNHFQSSATLTNGTGTFAAACTNY